MMKIDFFTILMILVVMPRGWGEDPGARVLLTKTGLSYLVEKVMPFLRSEINSLSNLGEDISGEKVGCHYHLKNLKIGDVKLSEPSLLPGNSGLMLKVDSVSLTGSGDYDYHCPLWIHGSGKVDISTSDSSLSLDIQINKDQTGHPQLVSESCSLDISNLHIDIHGSLSWLVDLFKGLIEDKLKSYANDKACPAIKDLIQKQGNTFIETFPIKMEIDKFTQIDYSLVDNAVSTEQYLQIDVKGEFISTNPNAEKPPFSPSSIPELQETGRMVFLVLSPYVANTAAFVFQEAGLLQYNVTPNSIKSSIPIPLSTLIFHELIPGFYTKYPDMNITFNIYSTKPPILEVDTGAAMLHGSGVIEFAVYDSNCDNAIVHAFSLDIEGSTEVKVGLNRTSTYTNVTGEVESFDVQVYLKDSSIGPVNATKLTELINQLSKQFLVPIVNRYIKVGWTIPVVEGVKLENLEIKLGQGYILVGSDVSYNPELDQSLKQDGENTGDSVMKKLRPHVRF